VPILVLLNGPPASGKSTLARRWVSDHPLALNLDVDIVRAQLGRWIDQPAEAGVAARRLAIAMARTHLESGRDVIVPQLLARPDFIEQLAALAAEMNSQFVEVALVVDIAAARDAFDRRSENPEKQSHRDAAALVDRGDRQAELDRIHRELSALIDSRPSVHRVEVMLGDVDGTFARVTSAIDAK
jgi:predicted kinase